MAKTILIVDDSTSLRQAVSLTLTQAGYEVVEAGDGIEALAALKGRRFNLVLCDVNMPRMDGLTFLQEMKARPDCRFVPVVMLTTEGAGELVQRGKNAGAKAWMVKPFQPPRLLEVVAKITG